jgi:hypothetical protein
MYVYNMHRLTPGMVGSCEQVEAELGPGDIATAFLWKHQQEECQKGASKE